MTRLIITNGKLILPDRIETDKALICKDGKIEQIVSEEALELLPDDQIMDAGNNMYHRALLTCISMVVADMTSWMEPQKHS